jgi:hypothetical protein
MNATVDIEYQEYAQAFSEFIRERGALLPKALRGEGRQLASRLVKFTPPKTLARAARPWRGTSSGRCFRCGRVISIRSASGN